MLLIMWLVRAHAVRSALFSFSMSYGVSIRKSIRSPFVISDKMRTRTAKKRLPGPLPGAEPFSPKQTRFAYDY